MTKYSHFGFNPKNGFGDIYKSKNIISKSEFGNRNQSRNSSFGQFNNTKTKANSNLPYYLRDNNILRSKQSGAANDTGSPDFFQEIKSALPNERLNILFDNFINILDSSSFVSSLEQTAQQIFHAETATVWLYDSDNQLLKSPSTGKVTNADKGITGLSISERKVINCAKPSQHPNFDINYDSLSCSCLYIPIYNTFNENDPNSIFAVIVLCAAPQSMIKSLQESTNLVSSFSDDDISLAETFSKKLSHYSHFFSSIQLNNYFVEEMTTSEMLPNILALFLSKIRDAFNCRSVECWSSDVFGTSYLRYNEQNGLFEQLDGDLGVVSLCIQQNQSICIPNVLHSPGYCKEIDGECAESVLVEPISSDGDIYVLVLRRPIQILQNENEISKTFSIHEQFLIRQLVPFLSNFFICNDSNLDDDNENNQPQKKNRPSTSHQISSTLSTMSRAFNVNQAERLKALLKVAEIISGVLDIEVLISTIMERSCYLLNAERCSLFLVDNQKKELVTRFHGGLKKSIRLPLGRGIVGHTATTGEVVNISDAYEDSRFNKDVDLKTGFRTKAILTVPIYNNRGEIAGVTEMINKIDGGVFDKEDIQMMVAFNVFCSISLDNAKLYQSSLDLTRQLRGFVEMSSALNKTQQIDTVIEQILMSAKDIINATRATIFLIESKMLNTSESSISLIEKAKQNTTGNKKLIPFINTGLSLKFGNVFADEIVEIKQAKVFTREEIFYKVNNYKNSTGDSNESNDKDEEYLNETICGIPLISSTNEIFGVLEFCSNRKILKEDLKLLDCFAVFTSVSIEKSELQAIADLGYAEVQMNQMLPQEERKSFEVPMKMVIEENDREHLFKISFDAVAWDGIGHFKVLYAIAETFDILREFQIPNEKWCRFLIEISQMYKKVPYHNWRHAVDVTQFITYQLKLTNFDEKMTKFELFGYIVAAICHDVNHDGFTNAFNEKAETPLGILYKNQSVMETHHCAVAISVISKEECNIFQSLDIEQNKNMWTLIIQLILITDMAKHFEFLKMINNDLDNGPYDDSLPENRLKIMQLILKCADISNVSRPFELANKWCDVLCEEFFRQGDLEMANGMEYTSLQNDRAHLDKPKSQIGFYTFVCLPLYQTAARVFPSLDANVQQVQSNLKIWKEQAEPKSQENSQ